MLNAVAKSAIPKSISASKELIPSRCLGSLLVFIIRKMVYPHRLSSNMEFTDFPVREIFTRIQETEVNRVCTNSFAIKAKTIAARNAFLRAARKAFLRTLITRNLISVSLFMMTHQLDPPSSM